ncbi:Rust resistance kinase Lr10 [Bienertia sinuspersici]
MWKAKGKNYQNIDAFLKVYGSLAPKQYTYALIRKITSGFSDKLGEGGYAVVYKGKLCNGRLVAVKLLKQSKGSGEDFINEVASISRTNHVNIVALLGFCFEGNKRALIYEFMSNGSLEKFAYHGAREHTLPLETLFNIGVGIATGLDYLHRGCNARILHFDIKPHNILLDEEFRPKISDFGLARLCSQQENTISTMDIARGTIGYIAPEVFCRNFGGVSHKSDVYSYGMMILDIVCGRKNIISDEIQQSSNMYFPQWIYKRLQHGEEVGILNDHEKALERKMILVSLWCIRTYPSNRPSMTQVIEMLQSGVELLQMPPEPYISSPPTLANNSSETISLVE